MSQSRPNDGINSTDGTIRRHEAGRSKFRLFPSSARLTVLTMASVLLVTVCMPYLLFGKEHPDSCYIHRPLHRSSTHTTKVSSYANASIPAPLSTPSPASESDQTDLSDSIPAAEAVESSPLDGRRRHPRWFYQHQTIIMIGLLAMCILLKTINAIVYMRTPRRLKDRHHLNHLSESNQFIEMASTRSDDRQYASPGQASLSDPPLRLSSSSSPSSSEFGYHWWEMFRILFCYLWYLAAYFMCNGLKSILGDFSCSNHGNSVSGHYLFHCYTMWMVGYLHLSQKSLHYESIASTKFWRHLLFDKKMRIIDYAFIILYPLYTIVVVSILMDTYFYGFHSLRQIIYGFAFAVLNFVLCTGILESVEDRLTMRGLHTNTKQAPCHTIPSFSSSYHPIVAGLLDEWFYDDERNGRFYRFPLVALAIFQLVAWFILGSSPVPGFFHWADLIAVGIGFTLANWIRKHKLPNSNY